MLGFLTAAPNAADAPKKLGKRKPDPEHFWSGFLTLIAGTLSTNPKFKCITCEHEFQGSTRAAVHLHARDDPSNPVLKCPNITPEEARDIKRLYDTKQKKPAAKPPPPGGRPGLDGIKKVISGAMKDKVTELFARFVFMCILPFAIVEQIWFRGLGRGRGGHHTTLSRWSGRACYDSEYS